ncbi:hypothetical protein [Gordonia paraffinivorans]|uniref:hypothetical protein n=1 Tax=Gordonia paraffinivorans TaxID=175628 RepID=UPI0014484E5C|nr:hypothetical protein [Gordonia paraffinivorans]
MSERRILNDGDYRRAATLLRCSNPERTDVPGMNAVLAEAHAEGRLTHLVLGVAAHAYAWSPTIGTPEGQNALANIAIERYELEKETTTDA